MHNCVERVIKVASYFISEKQKKLFERLGECGDLLFACGPKGISANIVGPFCVRRTGDEDRLEMGDGTNHVHVDWDRVKRAEVGVFHGEGMLTVFDGDETLFRLYRPEGKYPKEIIELEGNLV